MGIMVLSVFAIICMVVAFSYGFVVIILVEIFTNTLVMWVEIIHKWIITDTIGWLWYRIPLPRSKKKQKEFGFLVGGKISHQPHEKIRYPMFWCNLITIPCFTVLGLLFIILLWILVLILVIPTTIILIPIAFALGIPTAIGGGISAAHFVERLIMGAVGKLPEE